MSHILVIGPQTIDANKQQRGVRLEILTFSEPAEYSRPAVARKPRIEIAGGLYHLITRGNNRKRIFQSPDDHLKFLRLLERQKAKLPFYVYAYCLMPNHVHLLAEMRDDPISRVMHGLLTAYSQYHNRKVSADWAICFRGGIKQSSANRIDTWRNWCATST